MYRFFHARNSAMQGILRKCHYSPLAKAWNKFFPRIYCCRRKMVLGLPLVNANGQTFWTMSGICFSEGKSCESTLNAAVLRNDNAHESVFDGQETFSMESKNPFVHLTCSSPQGIYSARTGVRIRVVEHTEGGDCCRHKWVALRPSCCAFSRVWVILASTRRSALRMREIRAPDTLKDQISMVCNVRYQC